MTRNIVKLASLPGDLLRCYIIDNGGYIFSTCCLAFGKWSGRKASPAEANQVVII